ncbi:hypothetical protein [Bdellovibrio sp. HCB337]|uniref:hypothetical protein n=1 Tax=Bdellovibrio sp. HCB337 TaxID=3394358 RepID=UPI0039A72E90
MKKRSDYLICAVVLIALLSTFFRLFFGVDFTDESQYLAQALGPLIGGKAFVTDRLFQQSGSLWATPFFWLYLKIVGSTTGIALFFRFIYFGFSLTTGFALFRALRKNLEFGNALALSVLPVLYIPFSMPAVSYNTMAVLMTVLSLSLLRLLKTKRSFGMACLLSITIAMAIYSYPITGFGFVILFLLEWKNKDLRLWMGRVFVGTTIALLVFAIPIFAIGLEEIQKNFEVARSISLLNLQNKIDVSKAYLGILAPHWLVLVSAGLTAIFSAWKRKSFEYALLPFLVIYYVIAGPKLALDSSFGFLIYACAFIFAAYLVKRIWRGEKLVFSNEVLVGCAMATIMAVTSTNGVLNAALGFSIALIFILESATIQQRRLPWIAWLSVVLIYCFAPWAFFYRDGRLPELTQQVSSGPFYGIYTNVAKAAYVKEVEEDFKSLPSTAQSIFVYDSFAAGYLFTTLRPMTFMYYMHPTYVSPGLRAELNAVFATEKAKPDIVFETFAIPTDSKNWIFLKDPQKNVYEDSFWNFFKNSPQYRPFIQKPLYTIYVRADLIR